MSIEYIFLFINTIISTEFCAVAVFLFDFVVFMFYRQKGKIETTEFEVLCTYYMLVPNILFVFKLVNI